MLLQMLLVISVLLFLLFAIPFVSSCFHSETSRKNSKKSKKSSENNYGYVEAGDAHILSRFESLGDQLFQDLSVPSDLSIYEPFIQDHTASRSHRTGVPYWVEKDHVSVTVKETQSLTEADSPPNTYAAASYESRPKAPQVLLQRQNKDGFVEAVNAHILSIFDSSCDQLFQGLSVPYEPFIQDHTASRSHRTGVPYGVEKDVTVKEIQNLITEANSHPNTYAAASSESRPKAPPEVLQHPIMFWSSKEISQFLCDTSERLKLRHKKTGRILTALETTSKTVFGDGCDRWDEKMDPEFIRVICRRRHGRLGRGIRHRRYNFESVRTLVDAFRNNKTHYLRLPKNIKDMVGQDLYVYFSSKFPELFPEVYKVMLKFCSNEDWFKEYLTGSI